MIIRGYEIRPDHTIRCTGCRALIGPTEPVKQAFQVRDGEVTGTFHSRACYQEQCQLFEEAKKGSENNE